MSSNEYGNPYNPSQTMVGLEAARAKAIDEATRDLGIKYDRGEGPMPAALRNDYRLFAVQLASQMQMAREGYEGFNSFEDDDKRLWAALDFLVDMRLLDRNLSAVIPKQKVRTKDSIANENTKSISLPD
jgi:hypothetical protein